MDYNHTIYVDSNSSTITWLPNSTGGQILTALSGQPTWVHSTLSVPIEKEEKQRTMFKLIKLTK